MKSALSRAPTRRSEEAMIRVLVIDDFYVIPLRGLSAEQAAVRLGAEPDFSPFEIEVTLLPLTESGAGTLEPFGYKLFAGFPTSFAPATMFATVHQRLAYGDLIQPGCQFLSVLQRCLLLNHRHRHLLHDFVDSLQFATARSDHRSQPSPVFLKHGRPIHAWRPPRCRRVLHNCLIVAERGSLFQ